MEVPLQPFDFEAHLRSRDATLQLAAPIRTTVVKSTDKEKEAARTSKLQELYDYCRLDDVDLAPEEYIANRLTESERDNFLQDGYIIVVSRFQCKLVT